MRAGRMTPAQERGWQAGFPRFGLTLHAGPIDWDQTFGFAGRRIVEIGFGMGASLVEMAKNAPDKNFIGIEVHSPGVGACLADAREAGLTNLRVMCHDAVEVFANMIPDGSLSTLQLFFPDPWHKKRHHKRRIVQLEFAEMVRQKLKLEEGIFHMATDWQNYAEHMIEVMNQAPGFDNIAPEGDFIPRP